MNMKVEGDSVIINESSLDFIILNELPRLPYIGEQIRQSPGYREAFIAAMNEEELEPFTVPIDVNVESQRYEYELEVDLSTPESRRFKYEDLGMPNLMALTELVNNAVEHNSEGTKDLVVSIKTRAVGNLTNIVVKNNGSGKRGVTGRVNTRMLSTAQIMDFDAQAKSTRKVVSTGKQTMQSGVGTQLVYRSCAFSGAYDGETQLPIELSSEGRGYTVTLRVSNQWIANSLASIDPKNVVNMLEHLKPDAVKTKDGSSINSEGFYEFTKRVSTVNSDYTLHDAIRHVEEDKLFRSLFKLNMDLFCYLFEIKQGTPLHTALNDKDSILYEKLNQAAHGNTAAALVNTAMGHYGVVQGSPLYRVLAGLEARNFRTKGNRHST